MLDTSFSFRTFDFLIVIPQPDGIDAVYFSQKDTTSFSSNWSPAISGTYHLKFTSMWADYVSGMDIYAKVIKRARYRSKFSDVVTCVASMG
jgi:hypothetical protein